MSKITVDELKLFLGNRLNIINGYTGDKEELDSFWFEDVDILLSPVYSRPFEDNDCVIQTLDKFKPCVQPLDKITDEILDKMSYAFSSVWRNGKLQTKPIYFTLHDALILAQNHYDIFGWLDRVGDDGEPLGVVKEDV